MFIVKQKISCILSIVLIITNAHTASAQYSVLSPPGDTELCISLVETELMKNPPVRMHNGGGVPLDSFLLKHHYNITSIFPEEGLHSVSPGLVHQNMTYLKFYKDDIGRFKNSGTTVVESKKDNLVKLMDGLLPSARLYNNEQIIRNIASQKPSVADVQTIFRKQLQEALEEIQINFLILVRGGWNPDKVMVEKYFSEMMNVFWIRAEHVRLLGAIYLELVKRGQDITGRGYGKLDTIWTAASAGTSIPYLRDIMDWADIAHRALYVERVRQGLEKKNTLGATFVMRRYGAFAADEPEQFLSAVDRDIVQRRMDITQDEQPKEKKHIDEFRLTLVDDGHIVEIHGMRNPKKINGDTKLPEDRLRELRNHIPLSWGISQVPLISIRIFTKDNKKPKCYMILYPSEKGTRLLISSGEDFQQSETISSLTRILKSENPLTETRAFDVETFNSLEYGQIYKEGFEYLDFTSAQEMPEARNDKTAINEKISKDPYEKELLHAYVRLRAFQELEDESNKEQGKKAISEFSTRGIYTEFEKFPLIFKDFKTKTMGKGKVSIGIYEKEGKKHSITAVIYTGIKPGTAVKVSSVFLDKPPAGMEKQWLLKIEPETEELDKPTDAGKIRKGISNTYYFRFSKTGNLQRLNLTAEGYLCGFVEHGIFNDKNLSPFPVPSFKKTVSEGKYIQFELLYRGQNMQVMSAEKTLIPGEEVTVSCVYMINPPPGYEEQWLLNVQSESGKEYFYRFTHQGTHLHKIDLSPQAHIVCFARQGIYNNPDEPPFHEEKLTLEVMESGYINFGAWTDEKGVHKIHIRLFKLPKGYKVTIRRMQNYEGNWIIIVDTHHLYYHTVLYQFSPDGALIPYNGILELNDLRKVNMTAEITIEDLNKYFKLKNIINDMKKMEAVTQAHKLKKELEKLVAPKRKPILKTGIAKLTKKQSNELLQHVLEQVREISRQLAQITCTIVSPAVLLEDIPTICQINQQLDEIEQTGLRKTSVTSMRKRVEKLTDAKHRQIQRLINQIDKLEERLDNALIKQKIAVIPSQLEELRNAQVQPGMKAENIPIVSFIQSLIADIKDAGIAGNARVFEKRFLKLLKTKQKEIDELARKTRSINKKKDELSNLPVGPNVKFMDIPVIAELRTALADLNNVPAYKDAVTALQKECLDILKEKEKEGKRPNVLKQAIPKMLDELKNMHIDSDTVLEDLDLVIQLRQMIAEAERLGISRPKSKNKTFSGDESKKEEATKVTEKRRYKRKPIFNYKIVDWFKDAYGLDVVAEEKVDDNQGEVVYVYLASDYGATKSNTVLGIYKCIKKVKYRFAIADDYVPIDLGELDIIAAYEGTELSILGRTARATVNKGKDGHGICYVRFLSATEHEKQKQFSIPKEYMKKYDLVGKTVVLRVEEVVNRGQIICIYKEDDFKISDFSAPLATYEYFPDITRHYASGDVTGICKKVDSFAALDVWDYYHGKQMKPVEGRKMDVPIMYMKYGGYFRAETKIHSKRITFPLLPEAQEIFKKIMIEQGINSFTAEAVIKEEPDFGSYILISYNGTPVAKNYFYPNLAKNTSVDFARLAFTEYILGNKNIYGKEFLPREYHHPNPIPKQGIINLNYQGRELSVGGLTRMAGEKPVFVPEEHGIYGWQFNVYSEAGCEEGHPELPIILVRDSENNTLIPIEKAEEIRKLRDKEEMHAKDMPCFLEELRKLLHYKQSAIDQLNVMIVVKSAPGELNEKFNYIENLHNRITIGLEQTEEYLELLSMGLKSEKYQYPPKLAAFYYFAVTVLKEIQDDFYILTKEHQKLAPARYITPRIDEIHKKIERLNKRIAACGEKTTGMMSMLMETLSLSEIVLYKLGKRTASDQFYLDIYGIIPPKTLPSAIEKDMQEQFKIITPEKAERDETARKDVNIEDFLLEIEQCLEDLDWAEITIETKYEDLEKVAESIAAMIKKLAGLGYDEKAREYDQELRRIFSDKKDEHLKIAAEEKGKKEQKKRMGRIYSEWKLLPFTVLPSDNINDRLCSYGIISSNLQMLVESLPELIVKDPELAYSVIDNLYALPSLPAKLLLNLNNASQSLIEKVKEKNMGPKLTEQNPKEIECSN